MKIQDALRRARNMNLSELRDELAALHGDPPYDHPMNLRYNDNHFAKSIEVKFGASLGELEQIVRILDREIAKRTRGR